jgi:uncharacterized membrane protein YbhN (UPF0104 family)
MAVPSLKKGFSFSIKGAVTLGLIWFVLRDQDLHVVGERLSAMSAWSVLVALALLAGQNVLAAQRWVIVMRQFGDAVPYKLALRFYFEGLFFNQALPSTVGGDGVRMFRVVKSGIPVGAGVNGVLLDRIAGLFALLAIVALTQPWLYERVESFSARTAFAIVIAAGFSGVLLLMLCSRLPGTWTGWGIVRGLVGLSSGLASLLRHGGAVPVLALSFAGHLMMVLAIFVLARDLGLGVSYMDCLVLVPGVMLLAAAPISIAGWGVRESVMISAMALVGAPETGALGLSLVYGLIMLVIGLLGGALWLANPDRKVTEIETLQDAEKTAEGKPAS